MKTQLFHHAQRYSSKNLLKENQNLEDIITLLLISSFNTSQNIIFQKASYKNIPIRLKVLLELGPKKNLYVLAISLSQKW
jgi:hypothetical protein